MAGASKNAIAVLPLQNLNGDFSVDYLRFALADEIANTLTYSRTLDVRPSAVTRKYVNADLDPQQVGHELHVATVLTGHFQKQGHASAGHAGGDRDRDGTAAVANQSQLAPRRT